MTEKPPLFLHIGTHKTGTTSIQEFAARNRNSLRRLGIVYPKTPVDFGPQNAGHHYFSNSFADKVSPGLTEEDAFRFLSMIAADMSDGERAVLSAEPFWSHTKDMKSLRDYWAAKDNFVKYAKKLLSNFFDTKVIVYLRRQDDYVFSLFKEKVLQGTWTSGFEDFVKARSDALKYHRQLAPWIRHFGQENIYLRRYDGSKRGKDHVDSFFEIFGANVSSIEKQNSNELGETNVSLTGPFVEFKQRLNVTGFQGRQSMHARLALEELAQDDESKRYIESLFVKKQKPFPDIRHLRQENRKLLDALGLPEQELFDDDWRESFNYYQPKDEDALRSFIHLFSTEMKKSFGRQSGALRSVALDFNRREMKKPALQYLHKAIMLNPSDPQNFFDIARILAEQCRWNRISYYDKLARKTLGEDDYAEFVLFAQDASAKV